MSIDTTTAELFVWIAITVFLIVVPVVLLFKQQLPYVLDIIHNLKNIGLPNLPNIPNIKKKWNKSIREETKEVVELIEEVKIENLSDPFEEKHEKKEESVFEEIEETPVLEIEKELDTWEKWLIDIDAMVEQPDVEEIDQWLSGKQQSDLESIKYAALSHKERGKLDLFEKKLIEWLAIDPNSNDLLKMLGDHYFESWNLVKALTILKKIINEEGDNHKAIRQIAQIYLQQKQHDTAQLLVEKAIQLKPDNPKYHITMVEIFYANKQIKPAVKSMENVLKLRPTNKNYMLTLAGLHEEMGEPTKAKIYYKKILQIDPSNEVAKRSLKRLSFK